MPAISAYGRTFDYRADAEAAGPVRWDVRRADQGQIVEYAYADAPTYLSEAGPGSRYLRITDRSQPAGGQVSYYALPMRIVDVAALLGVAGSTIRAYRRDGRLPAEDGTEGRSPWWLPSTISQWQASRPGRGVGGGRPRKA